MIDEHNLEPYKTSDTPFAAFLHFKGMVAVTTRDDPNDYKREIFVFVDTPERPEYERQWREDQTGHRSYYASLKTMQHMLRGRKRNR